MLINHNSVSFNGLSWKGAVSSAGCNPQQPGPLSLCPGAPRGRSGVTGGSVQGLGAPRGGCSGHLPLLPWILRAYGECSRGAPGPPQAAQSLRRSRRVFATRPSFPLPPHPPAPPAQGSAERAVPTWVWDGVDGTAGEVTSVAFAAAVYSWPQERGSCGGAVALTWCGYAVTGE